jgi:hypothetical protein
MERLISLARLKAFDRVGERLAFFRQLIDLASIVTHPRGDVVEGVRNGPQPLNSIHASTNTDRRIGMHAGGPRKSGRSPHF